MVVCIAATVAFAVAAIFVSREWWLRFFAHPQVDSVIAAQGVTLWREMLGVTAAGLMCAWLMLRRLGRAEKPGSSCASDEMGRTRPVGLIGLVVVAALIRATRINESLWYDEIASWRTYNGGTNGPGAVLGAFLDPINHVFHTLLNRWSVEALYPTLTLEAAFRMPALLFALMTVPVMFALGRASAGDRVGWIAAMLAAFAPVCVLESVEARGYAQMIFFSAAATLAFILAFRRASVPMWLLYALCCALGVWSHFVTAWIAIGHGAWLMWKVFRVREDRTRCLQGFTAVALGGMLSITLYSPLLPGLLAWRENFEASNASQPRIVGPEGWHAILQLGGSWLAPAAFAGLIMFFAGTLAVLRRTHVDVTRRITTGDALTLALIGLPLMLLAVSVGGTWLYARFMLFSIPGALLAMAIGVDRLWDRRRIVGVSALSAIIISSLTDLASRPPKQPLREVVEYLRAHRIEGDRVVAVSLAHDVLSVYAYDMKITDSFFFGSDLAETLDAIQPRWVIVEYPLHVPADRFELLKARGYAEVAHLPGWADWGHGDVLLFDRTEPPPVAAAN